MGLIDLKTDLKSLRYGKDTIGGGYSGQPYIQTPIPESFNDLGANEDFILRGGINAVRDSATDIKRLTKMFFDLKSPNGLLFIAKQNVLSNAAVRTQTSTDVNEGIYTPLNTLAEAGVVAFGGHLNKQGINPFEETGAYANSEILYSVKVKPTQLVAENRLARLYQLISANDSGELNGFTLNNGNVLTYNGGPNSILGVGKTNIRFASQRTGNNNALKTSNPNYFIGSDGISGTPVYLSERGDIPNYINSFTGSRLIDTNNVANNPLLARDEFKVLSPFVTNNSLVTNVIPESQRTTDSFYVKSVDTIYLEGKGKQQGGLEITTELKPWIRSGLYELPDFNVNSPQSGSLSKIPTGPLTWTAKQDATGSNGPNYRIGTPTSIEYDVSGNKGVTNILGLDQPTFVTPSVYQPSGSGQPLLSSNDRKTLDNGTITYNQAQIENSDTAVRYNQTGRLIDFRKVIRNNIERLNNIDTTRYIESGQLPTGDLNYSTQNIGDKNLLGNPGANRINKNYSAFSKGIRNKDGTVYKGLDLINASDVNPQIVSGSSFTNTNPDLSKNDLIQFRIQSLFTGGSSLAFRAFLGSISDSYSATLNTQQYVGRGENFYTYGGQSRKISLSWTVAALSREELLPMYKRLSYLAGMTAPKYVNGFMQGPLVNLTVGGYIYNLPGYIEGFSLEMAEDSTWEIAIDENGEKDNTISQLTHIIKVSGFNFQPIPNYIPEVGARFISITNPAGTQL
jgi:hypothetical protein